MIQNVISQRKTKTGNMNVNVYQNSWRIGLAILDSGKSKLVRVMRNTN